MNEITRIHLGRQAFTIAIDAHKALRMYLDAIKKAVGVSHEEIVEEVELRMAELLMERGISGDRVIVAADIDYLKTQLGTPGDFKDTDTDAEADEEEVPSDDPERAPRRLFRDMQQGMVAGVLAGLAAYTGLPPLIMRILFLVLAVITSGAGVLLYIIMWLIIPPAITKSERLQMRGKPVTVDSLKRVADQADVENVARRVGRNLRPVMSRTMKVVLGTVGVGFVIVSVFLWIGAIVAGFLMLFLGFEINGVPLFPLGAKEVGLTVSGLVIAGVIATLLCLIGLATIRRRWQVKGWVAGLLAGLFILASSAGTILAIDTFPGIKQRREDLRHTKVLNQPVFQKLNIINEQSNRIFAEFIQSDRYAVELYYEGSDQRDLSKLATVADGTLTLDLSEAQDDRCNFWCLDGGFGTVKIFAPALSDLQATGNVHIDVSRAIEQEAMDVRLYRDSGFSMYGVDIAGITVQDRQDESYRAFALKGIQDNYAPQPLPPAFSAGNGQVVLDRIGQIEVVANEKGCAPGGYAPVQLLSFPASLVINNQPFNTAQLAQGQENTRPDPAHCVVVANEAYGS